MYIQIKTHKFNADSLNTTDELLEHAKVRPIVSCCGSPTELVAGLVTTILSPLLQFVPSHLENIHTHLEQLGKLDSTQLKNLKFCSGDISALYTNIEIDACVNDVIEFANEHIDSLNLCGLTLRDIHELLELVLTNSYFTYDGRLYKQLVGLFMGCRPSPIAAIIRVYRFERASIYIDITYITLHGRYIDDAYTVTEDEE